MSAAVKNQVLRLESEQVRAVNRGDVAGATRMFDRSFSGFSSTRHERIAGLQALARTFHYYLEGAEKIAYRITRPKVHAGDGVAVVTFYWTVGLGRGRTVRGRGTHVFVRKGRKWSVVHEHFSRAH